MRSKLSEGLEIGQILLAKRFLFEIDDADRRRVMMAIYFKIGTKILEPPTEDNTEGMALADICDEWMSLKGYTVRDEREAK